MVLFIFWQSLPFLEFELHTQLLSKLKVRHFSLMLLQLLLKAISHCGGGSGGGGSLRLVVIGGGGGGGCCVSVCVYCMHVCVWY